jgi:hypothetical protein
VQSFNLSYRSQTLTDAQGNQHLQAGTYTKLDGTIRAVDDVWFAADTARTLELDEITANENITALPELTGFGSVRRLHQEGITSGSLHKA